MANGRFMSKAEQKAFVQQKQKEREENDKILRQLEEMEKLGVKLTGGQQAKINKLKEEKRTREEINQLNSDTTSLESKINKLMSSQVQKKKKLGDRSKDVLDSLKEQKQKGMSAEDYQSQLTVVDSIVSGQVDLEGILKTQKDLGENISSDMKDYLNTTITGLRQKEKEKGVTGALDKLSGGMASNAMDAYKQFKLLGAKSMMMTAGLGAAVAILISFSGKMDAIGQQFGAVGIHSSAIRGDLLGAEQEAVKLGKSLEDVITSVTTLTSEFGTSFSEARGLASSVVDTSVALGLGVSEAAQLIGTFSTISGLSNDTATALAKQTTLLATASDVAPQQVLKDIAGSTETVAKFTDSSGQNIARAAIQARKLGIDLNTAAGAAESMLDFNNAVQKSMEASVLLGREINVRKLQELSLAGDLEGVAKEQRRLLGDQTKFLGLNVIQRKALAQSIGLSVDQATKMLDKQEEAITLAGQLAGQPGFDELVGEKGISTLTRLTGSLKSLGAVLTNSLGPILNLVLKLLVGVGKLLEFVLTPFNALFRGINEGIDNSFVTPTAPNMPSLSTEGKIKKTGVAEVHAGESVGVFNEQIIVDAINSLKLTTKITNKELNIIMTPSNG